MKKHIILLSAAGLLFSSCGVYTKYKPATEVPDGLYGEEMAAFTESLAGSPAVTEDSLDLGLGGMDWHELFTDPHLQALIGQGLQNNTDYQSAQLRVEEAEATLLSAMETAGKEIEDDALRQAMKDCGIGTPATRASIIETLFKRGYMERCKKSLSPPKKGLPSTRS